MVYMRREPIQSETESWIEANNVVPYCYVITMWHATKMAPTCQNAYWNKSNVEARNDEEYYKKSNMFYLHTCTTHYRCISMLVGNKPKNVDNSYSIITQRVTLLCLAHIVFWWVCE